MNSKPFQCDLETAQKKKNFSPASADDKKRRSNLGRQNTHSPTFIPLVPLYIIIQALFIHPFILLYYQQPLRGTHTALADVPALCFLLLGTVTHIPFTVPFPFLFFFPLRLEGCESWPYGAHPLVFSAAAMASQRSLVERGG